MSKESIGYTLKKYRELNNITVIDISKKLNKSVKTIYAWEHGRGQPDIETLIKLCRIYNINDFEVFAETPVTNKNKTHISVDDKKLLTKYHTLDTYGKEAVDSILNIEAKRIKEKEQNEDGSIEVLRAARSLNHKPIEEVTFTKERIEKIQNAPTIKDGDI